MKFDYVVRVLELEISELIYKISKLDQVKFDIYIIKLRKDINQLEQAIKMLEENND